MSQGTRWDNEHVIEKYLPDNYVVEGVTTHGVVISGHDVAGWTLDGYVLPRLASGVLVGSEIDLSHPAMREIPLDDACREGLHSLCDTHGCSCRCHADGWGRTPLS